MNTNKEMKLIQNKYRLKNPAVSTLLSVSYDTVKNWHRSQKDPAYRNVKETHLAQLKIILYLVQNIPLETLSKNPPPFNLNPLIKAKLLPESIRSNQP